MLLAAALATKVRSVTGLTLPSVEHPSHNVTKPVSRLDVDCNNGGDSTNL